MSVSLRMAASCARLTFIAALCGAPATAQEVSCLLHESPLLGPLQPTTGTQFGQSVSTDGVRTAVGMPFADHPTLPGVKGAVRVYELGGVLWGIEGTVHASNAAPAPGYFGERVALDGDVLAVALLDGSANRVYVFRNGPSGWLEEAQLTPPDGPTGSGGLTRNFGASLDVGGDTIAIGADNDDDFGAGSGAVYVFRYTAGSWALETKLAADDALPLANFGAAVDLDGERLLVGAPGRRLAPWVTGAGYVFERSGGVWTLAAHLQVLCCSSYVDGPLGRAVALRGDHAALGTVESWMPGLTFVVTFSRAGGTWTKQADLQSQNPGGDQWFGQGLDFASEERLIVADATALNGAQSTGEVQVFDFVGGQWAGAGIVYPTLDDTNPYFGRSISAEGSRIVVGAPATDISQDMRGAVYFVHIGTAPTRYCTAKTNSAGCVPSVIWSGTPSFADPVGFTVGAVDVLAQQVGLLVWAQSAGAQPFGGGTLCVGSPLTRTPGQSSGGGALGTCTGSYAFTFDTEYLLFYTLGWGFDVHAQYWSRDTGFAPPNAIGLTDAVLFTVCP
jgi:hypothetical protein